MKSKETIEIEFAKAIGEAQELEDVASALADIGNSIITKDIVMLEKAWKGNNSLALSMKNRTLSEDFFEAAQNLFSVAKSIRKTADLIYRAEKAAIFIASK